MPYQISINFSLQRSLPRLVLALLLTQFIAFFALAQEDLQPVASDAVILEMERAFNQQNAARLTQLLPKTVNHPLHAYASYWEMRARLERSTPDEIRDYLTRWSGSYWADRLRNDWLLILGQAQEREIFAAEYPLYRMRDDVQVRCLASAWDLLPAQAREHEKTLSDWYNLKSTSSACDSAIAQGLARGVWDAAAVWRKVRLSAELKQHSAAAHAASLLGAEIGQEIARTLARPQSALEQGSISSAAAVVAVSRLAVQNPDIAAQAFSRYLELASSPPTAEEISWAWGMIGKRAAIDLLPHALDYYARAGGMQGWSDEMLAWRVRTALRSSITQHGANILQSIESMSAAAQADSTWVYWRARVLAQSPQGAQRAQAKKLYQSIAGVQDFYALLAQEELGYTHQLPARVGGVTQAELDLVQGNPSLSRALYAIGMGLRTWGNREWNYALHLHEAGGLPPRQIQAASYWACYTQVYDRCINSSDRMGKLWSSQLRYPTPYRDMVQTQAANSHLPASLIYGIMRQESRFVTQARSGVGAAGLMQVMPATAQWTARKMGLDGFSNSQINDTATNIFLGSSYLRLVLDEFLQSPAMAAAAYNAGPKRVREWRRDIRPMEGAIWVENIPFGETRDYVKKVLSNHTIYALLLLERSTLLKNQLGTISSHNEESIGNPELP